MKRNSPKSPSNWYGEQFLGYKTYDEIQKLKKKLEPQGFEIIFNNYSMGKYRVYKRTIDKDSKFELAKKKIIKYITKGRKK